ncbi:hypothetical protein P879_05872 [Paragonimus westermani]|uniref:Cilia- and flagella-associated protein 300 n=1 Tax=Paragonimus westermani TaxID=34504 RepID=A0A8T0CZ28_9TREM|nr:hypothetical protein P879_05872 [Paragonimus westermani]
MTKLDGDSRNSTFTFIEIQNRQYPSIHSKEAEDSLMKWSMKGRLKIHTFTFDENFRAYDVKNFIHSFLRSPAVMQILHDYGVSNETFRNVSFQQINCTMTDMKMIKKIEDVTSRPNGVIKKCFDEVIAGVLVSDELRKFLLDEDFEASHVLTEKEKSEFLYKVFFHLSIGGELCQNEDNIKEYSEFTRKVYRDIISVQKSSETKELQIVSLVYKVRAEDENGAVFPSNIEHVNTFAYVIVDPYKRNVILLHHVFGCGEF